MHARSLSDAGLLVFVSYDCVTVKFTIKCKCKQDPSVGHSQIAISIATTIMSKAISGTSGQRSMQHADHPVVALSLIHI